MLGTVVGNHWRQEANHTMEYHEADVKKSLNFIL